MTQTFLVSSLCVTLLFGCADVRVPEYQRPEAPAKSNWSGPSATTVSAAEVISPTWWQQFGDPYLNSLVAKAVAGNFDLKALAARIEVANAQIGEARAGALPSVDIAAAGSLGQTTGMGQPFIKQYGLGGQVSWDLDIWGKVEKGVQAQKAEFRATEADWRAGYLSIVAGVSTTYFQILALDEQIEQQQRALARNEQIVAIDETMLSNGLIADTELLRQRAESNRLTKDLLELRRSRDVTQNALATLLGVPAGEFKVQGAQLLDRVKVPAVPAGLPLDLLTRRPDVVAAEFRVLEAHNLMGQARLAQLPSVSLTGLAGTASFALSDLFKAFTIGLIPSIDLPAFNPGIKAHAKTTEAQVKVAEEGYRSTVLAAFEEVENTLVNLEAHKQQKEQLQKQVDQLQVVSDQTKVQLKMGLVSQLDVFENERSLLTAQLALLASHAQVLADAVTLYKALGGGWAQTPVEVTNARH
ncbi:MAG: efflux transporter outer membrane subunit [Burkholderiaceae bacterium]|nr:efflux transporter outer membrane subunit [Burkholderiaceae bacterium]